MSRLALLLAPLLLFGCADGPDAPASTDDASAEPTVAASGADTADDGSPPAAPASRPETVTDTISIEGMDEPIDLRLVTVEDEPLPFSTYVPADWSDETVSSGEGTAARFATGATGSQGVVTVFVPSEPNREMIDEIARAVAESSGNAQPLEPYEPWVRSGYTFEGDGQTGQVRIGEHAGVPFYVVTQFPYELGDGFAPRAALVLDRLRWADDGSAL